MIKKDLFTISTFLDPNFGPYSFPLQARIEVVRKIKSKLAGDSVIATPSKNISKAMQIKIQARTNFYKNYKEDDQEKVIYFKLF